MFNFTDVIDNQLSNHKSIHLVHANSDWQKHMAEISVKFEEECNEYLWSYIKYMNTPEGEE